MRSYSLLLLVLALALASVHCRTLHFNTSMASSCPLMRGGPKCNIANPIFWNEAVVPSNGDSLVVERVEVDLITFTPLSLASLKFNVNLNVNPRGIRITVGAQLAVGMLNAMGSFNATDGSVFVTLDDHNQGEDLITKGAISFRDINVNSMRVYGDVKAGNIAINSTFIQMYGSLEAASLIAGGNVNLFGDTYFTDSLQLLGTIERGMLYAVRTEIIAKYFYVSPVYGYSYLPARLSVYSLDVEREVDFHELDSQNALTFNYPVSFEFVRAPSITLNNVFTVRTATTIQGDIIVSHSIDLYSDLTIEYGSLSIKSANPANPALVQVTVGDSAASPVIRVFRFGKLKDTKFNVAFYFKAGVELPDQPVTFMKFPSGQGSHVYAVSLNSTISLIWTDDEIQYVRST